MKGCGSETVSTPGTLGSSEKVMAGRVCLTVRAMKSCWKFSLHFLTWFWIIARGLGFGADDVNPVRFGNLRPSEINPAMIGTIRNETHNLLETVIVMKRLESGLIGRETYLSVRMNSSRRFFAHAASLVPVSAGFSLP